ncbi:MAG: Fe-S cluster assembly protein SufD [Nanoarchaeota archaeon]|nr:Fe-S cluster assembly protein SufD [Nanoarchaeota archaeon]
MEPAWFSDYRKKALEKAKNAALPEFKYGLAITIKPDFDFSTLIGGEAKVKAMTKVPSGVEATEGNAFPKKFESFFKEFEEDTHKLFWLHQAHANRFLSITIPENKNIEQAIEIDESVEKGPLFETIFIHAKKGSSSKIILRRDGTLKTGYVSDDIRVIAEPRSKIEIITIQNLPKDCTAIQRRASRAKKAAVVNWIDLCFGATYTKSDMWNDLVGEEAQGTITVLFNGTGTQKQDFYTASRHLAPYTTSDILTKGVLNKQAKGLSRGLVKIAQNAQGSNGYEKQDLLLLSPDAEADAIPNLEIDNNEVRCTHGSTIGQIDAEKLFYLMSRGLSKEAATRKIVEGYFAPVLEHFTDPQVREKMEASILALLEE